jgi:predicted CoA-binding protein
MNAVKELFVSKAEDFLNLKALAIIGVSDDSKKFGNYVYKELKKKSINIYQIHKNHSSLNNNICYNSLESIPEKVDGVIINTKSEHTKSIIEEYFNKGINNFWIQRGSESAESREFCKSNEINAIFGKCIIMFANPVDSIHKFHRTIWNWFGKN